jgi:RimJ/RimL family protein N-acetyltransferase
MNAPALRALTEADWEHFRELRLFALRTEPGVFFSSYARETEFDRTEWISRIAQPGRCVFGLFIDGALVGISGIITSTDDPSLATAELVMSYLLPEYRGKGFSALFYEARLRWARAQSQFTQVRVSHRESNLASRRAIVRHGFTFVGRRSRLWPDGTEEDELQYRLLLPGPASEN